jgi:hypothetical protein
VTSGWLLIHSCVGNDNDSLTACKLAGSCHPLCVAESTPDHKGVQLAFQLVCGVGRVPKSNCNAGRARRSSEWAFAMAARGNGACHAGARHGHGLAASGRKGAASMAGPQWVRTFAMENAPSSCILMHHVRTTRTISCIQHSLAMRWSHAELLRDALAMRSRSRQSKG